MRIGMHDVIVVGGGPAGSKAATLMAKDLDILVLEEHLSSGSPMQCAGLVSDDVVRMSGVRPDVLNRIFAAEVHFPGGGTVAVRSKNALASLVDRKGLDMRMASKATDAGAEISYGDKYLGHSVSGGVVTVSTSQSKYSSKLLVGADGHGSAVAASLGDNAPKEYLRGIQVDVKDKPEHDDTMTLRLGSDLAPGFFTWEIPFGDCVRVGLCTSEDGVLPSDLLKTLLRRAGLQDKETVARYSGKVPLGGRRVTYGDNVLLIGDAAGQVKPISAGGLFPAFRSAPILADTAIEAIRTGNTSRKDLARYEGGWKKELGREFFRGYRIRRSFVKLSDADLDRICAVLGREDARNILDDIEVDRPGNVANRIMRNPCIAMRLLPTLLKAII
ncbi:MAG: NAD(P)/FAD-dependent oxidoreductase [Candidatus Methanoplasma sp.]|jgi:geranylgeranyl reductase family protein|nr:NAD(P)/FAD-dependent oxidoreductase [Candidatus Methanoplasma sp.]